MRFDTAMVTRREAIVRLARGRLASWVASTCRGSASVLNYRTVSMTTVPPSTTSIRTRYP